jgi:hypothetical protein
LPLNDNYGAISGCVSIYDHSYFANRLFSRGVFQMLDYGLFFNYIAYAIMVSSGIGILAIIMRIAASAPLAVIFWFLGPLLGLVSIFAFELNEKIGDFWQWLGKVYSDKLCDLYLIAVVTSAATLGDAFELAAGKTPDASGRSSVWGLLLFFNIICLVFVTVIAAKISDGMAVKGSDQVHTGILSHGYIAWIFIVQSILFGALFKFNVEKNKVHSASENG